MEHLANLHEILAKSAQTNRHDLPMVSISFRVDEPTKKAAEELCERHGTNLSSFFRECAYQLLREYCPEQE